jgi:hypothetical protein
MKVAACSVGESNGYFLFLEVSAILAWQQRKLDVIVKYQRNSWSIS